MKSQIVMSKLGSHGTSLRRGHKRGRMCHKAQGGRDALTWVRMPLMRFYRLKEAPLRPLDAVFAESRLRMACFSLGFTAIFLGGVIMICYGGRFIRGWEWTAPGLVFAWIWTGMWGLFSLFLLSRFRHTFGQDNWLVRYTGSSLLIKFRAYSNTNFSHDDEVVFELRTSEIEWIRYTRDTSITLSGEESTATAERMKCLDIKPKLADLSGLEGRLRDERVRKPTKGAKDLFCPVRVISGGIIRVEWRGQCTCIVPGLPTLMAMLRPSVKIAADEREDHDFTKTDGTRIEQESRVLELLERGQKMAAVKLVQKLYK